MDILERLRGEETWVDAVDDAANIIEAQALLIQKFVKHKSACNSTEKWRGSNGQFQRGLCNCGLEAAMRDIKKVAVG